MADQQNNTPNTPNQEVAELQQNPQKGPEPKESDSDVLNKTSQALNAVGSMLDGVTKGLPNSKSAKQIFADIVNSKNMGVTVEVNSNGAIVIKDSTVDKVKKELPKFLAALKVSKEKNSIDIDVDGNNQIDAKDVSLSVKDGKLVDNSEMLGDKDISPQAAIAKEKEKPGYLLELCTEKIGENKYKVNFPNGNLEHSIGLAHLFMSDEKVSEVTVSSKSDTPSKRDGLLGSFFNNGYSEILSGYEFEVTKFRTPEEIAELKKGLDEKANKVLQNENIVSLYTENGKVNPDKKAQVTEMVNKSLASNIDPYLVVSLMTKGNTTFSFNNATFEGNLMLSLKTAQIAKNQYKEIEGDEGVESDGFFKPNLAFGILEEFGNIDDSSKSAIESYYKFYGKTISPEDYEKHKTSYLRESKFGSRRSQSIYTGEVVSGYEKIDPKNLQEYGLNGINLPSAESLYSGAGSAFARYKNTIHNVCESLKIPESALIMLFIKEGSHGNPYATTPGSSAFGIAQTLTGTWNEITQRIAPHYGINQQWDKRNADHQIIAGALYLRKNADETKDRGLALAKYNMGSLNISDETARMYASKNPAIARCIQGPVTAASYREGARRYYTSLEGRHGTAMV